MFFFTSIIFEGGGTTIKSCLGHPFVQQRPWINVYFQEPSSICESEFNAYRLLYTGRPQRLLGFLTARFSQVCTRCILDINNTSGHIHASWTSTVDDDVKQGCKIAEERILRNFSLKGIVHPKMKMWCLSAYPKGIQDVGDFVSSVEHKQRFLTQTVAVCQSYNVSQWDSWL